MVILQLMPSSSFLTWWWSSKQGLENLFNHYTVCQLAMSLNASSSMPFHVVGPCNCLCARFPPACFSVVPEEICDQNIFVFSSTHLIRFAFTFRNIPNMRGHEMMCDPSIPIRIILAFDEQRDISISGVFLSPVTQEPCKWCPYRFRSWKTIGSVSVKISFERNHRIFKFRPWFVPFVSWETYLYGLTLEFLAIWERPPVLLECTRILQQLLVRHNLVLFQEHPLLLRQSLRRRRALLTKKA